MPALRPARLARFGRGRAPDASPSVLRVAGPTLLRTGAFLAGTGAVAWGGSTLLRAGGGVATKIGEAFNPPLDLANVDPDPMKRGDESTVAYDRKTGQLFVFGAPSSEKTLPARTIDRTLVYGILGAAAIGILFVLGRRK